jgi:hypothetical protein
MGIFPVLQRGHPAISLNCSLTTTKTLSGGRSSREGQAVLDDVCGQLSQFIEAPGTALP